jgi:hypothetical protein
MRLQVVVRGKAFQRIALLFGRQVGNALDAAGLVVPIAAVVFGDNTSPAWTIALRGS